MARGVSVHLVDRTGHIGGAYARIPGDMRMTSPANSIGLPGLPFTPSAHNVEVDEYRGYLTSYADAYQLAPEAWQVERVTCGGWHRFAATMTHSDDGSSYHSSYHSVVVATGMYDFPVRPVIPGLPGDGPATAERPAVEHAAAWRGARGVRGQRVLIIGGASSGVEFAEACAIHGAEVVVSTRSGQIDALRPDIFGFDPSAYILRGLSRAPLFATRWFCERPHTAPGYDVIFRDLQARALIAVRGPVARFDGRRAIFADGQSTRALDRVILATGYRHATPFLSFAVARTGAGYPRTRAGQSTSHPGLYFVGLPCAHDLASAYLYGMARDSLRVADAIAGSLSAQDRAPARGNLG